MLESIRSAYKNHGSTLFNPAFWAIGNYYYGVWACKIRLRPIRWIASKIYGFNLFIIMISSGIRLHRETKIGSDLHLIHGWNIRIAPKAVIGDRCGIQQDVVVGTNVERPGVPLIGNDVYIGAGAKILGNVKVGDNARIGANSLVTKDVPAGATAVGVPARILQYTGREIKD